MTSIPVDNTIRNSSNENVQIDNVIDTASITGEKLLKTLSSASNDHQDGLDSIELSRLAKVNRPNDLQTVCLSTVIEEIQGNSLAQQTVNCRTLYQQYSLAEKALAALTPEDPSYESVKLQVKTAKDAYKQAKTALPCITPHGVFKGTASNDHLDRYSGLVSIDIDDIPESDMAEIRRKLQGLPYVIFVFISPSGRGLKAAVKVDEHYLEENSWRTTFAQVASYFEQMDITIDPQCKDVSRKCFLAHDEDVYVNEKATSMHSILEQTVMHGSLKSDASAHISIDLIPMDDAFKIFDAAKAYLALKEIDPNCDYDIWIRIGMALYEGSKGNEIGLELWDEWSQKGKLKYVPGETLEKWKSFKLMKDGITLATLFHLSTYKHDLPNSMDSTLNKWIKKSVKFNIEEFSNYYAMGSCGNKTRIVQRTYAPGATGVELKSSFTSWQDFKLLQEHQNIILSYNPKNNKLGFTPIVTLWKNHNQRKTFNCVEFRPFAGTNQIGLRLPKASNYNLYTGLNITPKLGKCDLITKHIEEVLCGSDQEYFDYIMNWFARMYQFPNEPGRTALVFKSGEGAGKGIIMEQVIAKSFGSHATQISDSKKLTHQFNGFLGESVFVYLNEAFWSGSHQGKGILKSLITDNMIQIEKKGIDCINTKNCTHIVMSSNEDWVAPPTIEDRRFVIPDVSNHRIGDEGYFKALVEQVSNGGVEAFVYDMLHRDISNFNPAMVPLRSATMIEQIIEGFDSIDQWLYESLQAGSFTCTGYSETVNKFIESQDWLGGQIQLANDTLYTSYKESVAIDKFANPVTKTKLTQALKKRLGCTTKSTTLNNQSTRAIIFYDLAECRNLFSSRIKGDIDWEPIQKLDDLLTEASASQDNMGTTE